MWIDGSSSMHLTMVKSSSKHTSSLMFIITMLSTPDSADNTLGYGLLEIKREQKRDLCDRVYTSSQRR